MIFFCHRIGNDWTEICEQPELKETIKLDFDPETAEKVHLPLTLRASNIAKLCDSKLPQRNEESPLCQSTTNTTENDVQSLPTESCNDKKLEDICTSSIVPKSIEVPANTSNGKSDVEDSKSTLCSNEVPNKSGDVKSDVDDCKAKTAYLFSIENIPKGCYYLSHPNKYVFPGSTYTWYGSGNPDRDREENFEQEDDNEVEIDFEDDDEDEDDDDEDLVEDFLGDGDKCETESSTKQGDSDDMESVSPAKIQKLTEN